MLHASPEDARGNWCTLCEGLQESPQRFYTLVAAAVSKRNIPDAIIETVEHREGGALSGVRQYLRVRRVREAFDICGAPFGNAFFFSWWFADLRPALPRLATVLIVFGYLSVTGWFMQWLGVIRGPVTLVLLVPLILWGVSKMGTQAADDAMLSLPLLGPAYEKLFRPITYYRADMSAAFQRAVEDAVMEAMDQITEGKGVRALTEAERKPTMRDFWKK
jgi:hypothetical protein